MASRPSIAPTIALAESLGLDLAYTTSVDVHEDPASILGASGVVSLGHDEYWTVPTRRAVEGARDSGSNLAFLGANACYWRVRLEDSDLGRNIECVTDMTKSREAGFLAFRSTPKSLFDKIERYRTARIIP